MPLYDYRCDAGHVTEHLYSMSDDLPAEVTCGQRDIDLAGSSVTQCCGRLARRIFTVPAAHFHGGGFYATDYKGRYDRKRRPNPGDDLPIPSEAAITRAEGAEYDPPARMPETVTREDAPRSA